LLLKRNWRESSKCRGEGVPGRERAQRGERAYSRPRKICFQDGIKIGNRNSDLIWKKFDYKKMTIFLV